MVVEDGRATVGVVRGGELDPAQQADIIRLCEEAVGDDFGRLFRRRPGAVHVVARVAGLLVGHACWVPRRLEPDGSGPLRAAWVEAVATRPSHQGQGVGRALMRRVADEIQDYDLGALTAAVVPFYERLGWEAWRGVATLRTDGGPPRSPGEPVMILRVRGTPPLDLDARLAIEGREAPRP